ncbi:MAG: glycoside hydrolase family 97 protein [Bacteroides sp.]|nr:glycoside hydrolase family 97 protein [Bacteroides sp.]
MKKISVTLFSLFVLSVFLYPRPSQAGKSRSYEIHSPDGHITAVVEIGEDIRWQLSHDADPVLLPSPLSLTLTDGEIAGKQPRVSKVTRKTIDTFFETPFYKKEKVTDHYNLLLLRFTAGYSVEFRLYNDGAAYRFHTHRKGDLTIRDEEVVFTFAGDHKAFVPYINDRRDGERFTYSFESFYDEIRLSEMKKDSLAIVPLLVDLGNGKKAAILEGDLENYPGLFLTAHPQLSHTIRGVFAPYPLEGKTGGHNNLNFIATRRAAYIAQIDGQSTLPWRAIVISRKDTDLANNDMAQKLASPSRIADTSWIRPGKVAWDWWNSSNLTHVDFVAGMNNATYKYFIDFAAANHLEYIIIDAGWSAEETLMRTVPDIDIKELVEYGRSKQVGVILWASWQLTDKEADRAFPYYAAMGVKGFKVDFIDSDDQRMIRSVSSIAQKAADHKLLLNLHGFKATGMQRTYPNVVNFEGVKGLENFKWAPIVNGQIRDDAPRYDVTIPFIRMLAGPMDYTPGAMSNKTRETYRSVNRHPMSQGTRVHQLAMYTVYEAPLQMLADSPTAYMREQECTDFIAQVPTVFDETVVLDGEVGEYIILARRKGVTWYLGALTNWTAREKEIDFSFLGPGTYEAELFRDGMNANTEATDYRKEIIRISSGDKIQIRLYQGGGYTARIYPIQ